MQEIINADQKMEVLKAEFLSKTDTKGQLIPLLQASQAIYGYIPEIAMNYLSKSLKISLAEIYGVVTFYSQFRLEPMGEYVIRICEGTACHVNGAKTILSSIKNELGISVNQTSADGKFTLLSVACIGCCSLAPVIMVNNETHGSLTPGKIEKILKKYKNNG